MLKNRRILILISVIFLSLILHQTPLAKQLLKVLQLRTYDLILDLANAYQLNDSEPTIEDIVIVDIDEESISTLGQFSSWPTLYFADLVDSLANDNPLFIAFDIFFTESDSISAFGQQRIGKHLKTQGYNAGDILKHFSSDQQFARALKDAGNVILGMFNDSSGYQAKSLPPNLIPWQVERAKAIPLSYPKPPIELLASSAMNIGFAHIEPDVSGVIHNYPIFFEYKGDKYVNFSLQGALSLLGIDEIEMDSSLRLYREGELIRKVPLNSDGDFFFKYYGMGHRFRYVSFSDVLLGRIPHGFFEDKVVLVGSSATGLRDIKTSPLDPNFPGVELHATMLMNLLAEDYIYWMPLWLSWLIAILLVSGIGFAIRYLRPLYSLLIFIGVSLLLFLGFLLAFIGFSYVINYSVILLLWVLGFLSLLVNESQLQYREKKKVRHAFEHYVSKSVISQIMEVDNPLKVGGTRQKASILFCDIRSFSTLCELLPAEEIGDLLYSHFNRATKVIMENNGTLDKYIGDAVLALYSVPIRQEHYQLDACRSAYGIYQGALEVKEEYKEHPILKDFAIGVGIATGEIIAGNFGSDEIFNYTGIGDKMNLASRLESLNKDYRTNIIIDHATYQEAKEEFLCRFLDRACVKGKDEAVDIYELICPSEKASERQKELAELYSKAMRLLCELKPLQAKEAFEFLLKKYPDDYPSSLMLKRIKEIDLESWDGVFRHQEK